MLIDEVERGPLREGDTFTCPLAGGERQVCMKIDWCGSPGVAIHGGSDQRLDRLVCRAASNSVNGLFYITVWRDRYIELRRE